ncbi:plasmid mobilization protein [Desulfovibrio sp. 3_1_syn3]|uniref:plasmid mobilization protein n=1 Tax=Desulfovibrio sp. 3_1_syn3 TaxID=457398 RepID=UPI000688E126|nr:conjugal transfer protein [Desulfovibrio sp. 3_1_syn3]
MPTKKKAVTTYLTEKEFSAVQASASRAGLSLSRFLALTSQGQPVKSLEHQRERMELRRMKGEMGSIGGLLKQALAQSGDKSHTYPILRTLDNCLRAIQNLIARL